MPTYKKFTDFPYYTPTSNDYYVGYKSDGSTEIRSTLYDIVTSGLLQNSIYVGNGNFATGDSSIQIQLGSISFAQGTGHQINFGGLGFYNTALGVEHTVDGSGNLATGYFNSIKGDSNFNFVAGENNQLFNSSNSLIGGKNNFSCGDYNLLANITNIAASSANTVLGDRNVAASRGNHVTGILNRAGMIDNFDSYDQGPSRLITYGDLNSFNCKYAVGQKIIIESPASYGPTRGTTYVTTICAISSDYQYYDPFWGTVNAIFLSDDIGAQQSGTPCFVWGEARVGLGSSGLNFADYQHIEGVGNLGVCRGGHTEGYFNFNTGYYTHVEGVRNSANSGALYSHIQGRNNIVNGKESFVGGVNAQGLYDNNFAFNADPNSTLETSGPNSFYVRAPGGIFLQGKTYTNELSTSNLQILNSYISDKLTVAGTLSAKNLIADNISYNNAGFNTLPTYKTVQTNLAVKNSLYSTVSASLTAETGYFDSQATYAMQGGLIIKGHAKDYSTIPINLPEVSWPWAKGAYGLAIQNVDIMDPGTTFICDGRAQVTHGMTFRAGNNTFTGGSDHNHVMWTGSPSNNTQTWQMTNGGNNTNDVNTPITNRFMVHTLPQYQISTTITATSGFLDTTNANYNSTNTSIITGVKLLVSYLEANNYNLIEAGDIIGLQINPGLVGLVAVTYQSQVVSVSSNNNNFSAYTLNMYSAPGSLNLAARGVTAVSLKLRSNGGNPGVYKVTSQIGSPSTNYVGLTGNYKNVPKHVLAKFTNAQVLSGLKPGAPLSFWVPDAMPSSLGTGFVSSTRQTTPGSFTYGYFDAFVKSISGNELVFSIGNLMDTYHFETRTWTATAAGNAGWILYGGSNDTVHRPTFGTTGFYFEREPWLFTSTNNFAFLSGGMVKNVSLGNSESYGNYSYGLGYRGTVLGDKSATLAGDMNYVFGNNSVAIGGEGLSVKTDNSLVIGTYNDPDDVTSLAKPPFIIGGGTSDKNRNNVFYVLPNGSVISKGLISAQGIDVQQMVTGGIVPTTNQAATQILDVPEYEITTQVTTILDYFATPYQNLSALKLPSYFRGLQIVGSGYTDGFKVTIYNYQDKNTAAYPNLLIKSPTLAPTIFFNKNGINSTLTSLYLSAGYYMEAMVTQDNINFTGSYFITRIDKMVNIP